MGRQPAKSVEDEVTIVLAVLRSRSCTVRESKPTNQIGKPVQNNQPDNRTLITTGRTIRSPSVVHCRLRRTAA